MTRPDLVVTGMGAWSAAGTSPEALHEAALNGRCPATPLLLGDRVCAICSAPTPPPFPGFPQAHRLDRSAQLALAAAQAAYQDARLAELDPARIAVLVGNSRGPATLWSALPPRRTRPSQSPHTAIASLSGALSLGLRVSGPCLTVSATCASGAHAMGLGAALIQSDQADAVLVGGAEAPLVPPLLEGFAAAGILGTHPDPTEACRPFDLSRNGTVPGEGAAFLVVERASAAQYRGVVTQAVLAGFALGAECHNRVAARADGEGLVKVMTQALALSGLAPDDIAYVNAHGTGTQVNDAAEAAALSRVFGSALRRIPVSSTKAVTGHGFGAAAALEAVMVIQTLRDRLAPPTTGCSHPDLSLGLDLIVGSPRPITGRWAMSNSLGFWGNTACLIFGRLE